VTPAELTAITAGVGLLGGIGGWFIKSKTEPKPPKVNGNGGSAHGHLITSIAQQMGALASLTAAVASIGGQTGDVRDAVLRMETQLGMVPTREELNAVAEKNRHEYRNMLQRVEVSLDDLVRSLNRKGQG